MCIEYEFMPYKMFGGFLFGTERSKLIEAIGEPDSTDMYGYPEEDRFLDDYGYFHILCSKEKLFEAIELFPDMLVNDEMALLCNNIKVILSKDIKQTLNELKKITDDLCWVEDEEGYSSDNLGLKIYCPDGYIEDIIIFEEHYYDEENQYLEEEL